jgi:hypothetical protein
MNRQRVILFVLVIVFCLTAIWSYNAIPKPKTISTTVVSVKPQARQAKQQKPVDDTTVKPVNSSDDGTRLKLELLAAEPSHFKGYRRNIFKPVFVDPLKILKQQAIAFKPPPLPLPKPLPPPVIPSQVISQPETAPLAPLARFTFLGFLKKGTVKTIFLAKEKDILLVKKGDKIAGRYEATEITDQALTLTVSDSGDEIVIPLVENRSLAPAR